MTLSKFLSAVSLFTLLSYPAHSQAEELEQDPLTNFSVSKEEVLKSLDMLKSNGQISEKDYLAAKQQLSGMNASQISALKETAVGMVRNDPDKAVELSKGKFDAEATKKQINDLSKPK